MLIVCQFLVHVILAPSSGWSLRVDTFLLLHSTTAFVTAQGFEVSASGTTAPGPAVGWCVLVCSQGVQEIGLIIQEKTEGTRTVYMSFHVLFLVTSSRGLPWH